MTEQNLQTAKRIAEPGFEPYDLIDEYGSAATVKMLQSLASDYERLVEDNRVMQEALALAKVKEGTDEQANRG